jgi:hypothetical protein
MTIGCPTSVVRSVLQLLTSGQAHKARLLLERVLATAEEIQQARSMVKPLPLPQDRGRGGGYRARGRAQRPRGGSG